MYLQSKETLPRGSKKPSQPHRVSFTGVDGGHGGQNGANLTYIDISPLDNETITAKTLPRTSVRNDTNGKIPSKIFASPENFKLSVRSLSQSSRSMISSSPEFMREKDIPLRVLRVLNFQQLSFITHKNVLSLIESIFFLNPTFPTFQMCWKNNYLSK